MNTFALGNYVAKVSEHSEQSTFFDWLLFTKLNHHPEIHPLWFSVPNGAHLAGDKNQRGRAMNVLKAEGFTPGVADTLFLSGRGGYLGLALEFKTQDKKNTKDGGLSEAQREFLRSVRAEGYQAAVAYGADEAAQIAQNYFAMPKTQDMLYRALDCAERGDLEGCKSVLQDVVRAW
jgi:hypothetical protein